MHGVQHKDVYHVDFENHNRNEGGAVVEIEKFLLFPKICKKKQNFPNSFLILSDSVEKILQNKSHVRFAAFSPLQKKDKGFSVQRFLSNKLSSTYFFYIAR